MDISNSRKEHFLINNTLQFIKLLPKQKHILFTIKYNTNIENQILFSLFDKINRLDINAGVLNHTLIKSGYTQTLFTGIKNVTITIKCNWTWLSKG